MDLSMSSIDKYNKRFDTMVNDIMKKGSMKGVCRKQTLTEFKSNVEYILKVCNLKVKSSDLDELYTHFFPGVTGKGPSTRRRKGNTRLGVRYTNVRGNHSVRRNTGQRGGGGKEKILAKLSTYRKSARILSLIATLTMFGVFIAWTFHELRFGGRYNSLIGFLTHMGFVGTPVCGVDGQTNTDPLERVVHDMVSRPNL